MSMHKQFHLGDILSITTGKLLSPSKMDGVYSILNFMTGQELYTHQLGRAAEVCKPYLEGYYPQFKGIEYNKSTDIPVAEWLKLQCEKHYEFHLVTNLPEGAYKTVDVLTELCDLLDNNKLKG
jgi:hypothetical protein